MTEVSRRTLIKATDWCGDIADWCDDRDRKRKTARRCDTARHLVDLRCRGGLDHLYLLQH